MIRILLVEDDKNFSFIIQSSLEQMIGGYEVVTASNGKEGLEKLAQATFDVIISDIEMPVLDGITMVQQIREQYP
ncbi:MAG: response regulator, partial [Parabacteroides sp.]|nr:response regulator [Parabacteroides sp.]